jgi:trans-aconitate 2-methyltransferase
VWDPQQYLRFGDERARPFRELVARIGTSDPRTVVDLGCGPGTLTVELADRWPAARIVGVDSSPEMIGTARHASTPNVEYVEADVAAWRPPEPVDVVVANALFQWVPDHVALFADLVGHLTDDGWFAFQVPGNFDARSHTRIRDLRRSARWRERLATIASGGAHEPVDYARRFLDLGLSVDAWETTYVHVLDGDDAVLEWVKGTTLRPVLARLDESERAEFLAELGERFRHDYPSSRGQTLFPFRRIFVVAHRPPHEDDEAHERVLTSRG